MICGGVAGCYTANLGPQPRGQAQSYYSSQQPTTIVCVFVYREICRPNPMCGGKKSGRFDSVCEGFYLKGIKYPNIKLYRLHCSVCLKMCTGVVVVKVPCFAACNWDYKDSDSNKLVLVWYFNKCLYASCETFKKELTDKMRWLRLSLRYIKFNRLWNTNNNTHAACSQLYVNKPADFPFSW